MSPGESLPSDVTTDDVTTVATATVTVSVNGQAEAWPAGSTLDAVVARLAPSRTGIAVAVGDTVVPRAQWDARVLHEGDEIEILTAVAGG